MSQLRTVVSLSQAGIEWASAIGRRTWINLTDEPAPGISALVPGTLQGFLLEIVLVRKDPRH